VPLASASMVLLNWNPSRPATTMDAQAVPIVILTLLQQFAVQEATVTCAGVPQESVNMVLQNWNPSRLATTMDAQALPIVTRTLLRQSVVQEATVTCVGVPLASASMGLQNWKRSRKRSRPAIIMDAPAVLIVTLTLLQQSVVQEAIAT